MCLAKRFPVLLSFALVVSVTWAREPLFIKSVEPENHEDIYRAGLFQLAKLTKVLNSVCNSNQLQENAERIAAHLLELRVLEYRLRLLGGVDIGVVANLNSAFRDEIQIVTEAFSFRLRILREQDVNFISKSGLEEVRPPWVVAMEMLDSQSREVLSKDSFDSIYADAVADLRELVDRIGLIATEDSMAKHRGGVRDILRRIEKSTERVRSLGGVGSASMRLHDRHKRQIEEVQSLYSKSIANLYRAKYDVYIELRNMGMTSMSLPWTDTSAEDIRRLEQLLD